MVNIKRKNEVVTVHQLVDDVIQSSGYYFLKLSYDNCVIDIRSVNELNFLSENIVVVSEILPLFSENLVSVYSLLNNIKEFYLALDTTMRVLVEWDNILKLYHNQFYKKIVNDTICELNGMDTYFTRCMNKSKLIGSVN